MFHFRLKSDKKPNGTKISAVKHVEYINREGAFSDDGHRQGVDKFVGNFITTDKIPNALLGKWVLLYKSNGLGLIRNTTKEIVGNEAQRCIVLEHGGLSHEKIFSGNLRGDSIHDRLRRGKNCA